jgi:DNA-binding transcriptional regulator YdaS (Cro superfamily)
MDKTSDIWVNLGKGLAALIGRAKSGEVTFQLLHPDIPALGSYQE